MSKKASAVLLDRIIDFAQRDRRKTIIIALTGFMTLALLCHFVFQGPSLATAALRPSGSDKFFNPSSDNSDGAGPTALSEWLKEPKQQAKRNLFTLNLDEYPGDSVLSLSGSNRLSQDQKDQPLWDQVAKSLAAQADQRREREFRLKNLQRAVSKLSLQKIIVGPPAKAQMNGEVIEEGGFIGVFRVVRIQPDRITVEKDGITLDVVMH